MGCQSSTCGGMGPRIGLTLMVGVAGTPGGDHCSVATLADGDIDRSSVRGQLPARTLLGGCQADRESAYDSLVSAHGNPACLRANGADRPPEAQSPPPSCTSMDCTVRLSIRRHLGNLGAARGRPLVHLGIRCFSVSVAIVRSWIGAP